MIRFTLIFVVLCLVVATVLCLDVNEEEPHRQFRQWSGTREPLWPFGVGGFNDNPVFRSASAPDTTASNTDREDFPELGIEFFNDGESNNPRYPKPPTFNNFPGSPLDPSDLVFGQTFPLFGNHPFFSGFSFNDRHHGPWWNGPNVCTERTEEFEDETAAPEASESSAEAPSGLFEFRVNSCVQKTNSYVCKTIVNTGTNGGKKTISVVRKCCHGFGRPANARGIEPCEKIDLKTVEMTSEKLGGKEFIRSAKNNGLAGLLTKNVTLFMPTDASFTDFSEQMFETNLVVLPVSKRVRRATNKDISGITTKEIAMAHMVDGWISIEDVENEQLLVSEYDNTTIRINIYQKPLSRDQDTHPYRYAANCAPIIKANQMAENGIVHVIDRVMMPVTKSIMEIVKERSDTTVLATILDKTNLAELLSNDEKQFTLLAPSDEAFAKLSPQLRRTLKEGKGCALNILKNHILELTLCSMAVVEGAKTNAYNILRKKMEFERSEASSASDTENTELADLTGRSWMDVVVNNEARFTASDIMGTNGVIHVIDTILPTESGLPITSMLEGHNLTVFKQLIEAGGFESYFDDMANVSFFAPTDKAFDASPWKTKLIEKPEELVGNEELKKFLDYHIGTPMTKTCELNDETPMPTVAGKELRVNLYTTHPVFTQIMNRATINCARLIHFDDQTCGAVLHQVDKVLTPPKNNLLQALEANENYSMFLDLVKQANLTALLESEEVGESYTLLVPSNDIFAEVKELYDETRASQGKLEEIIKDHILPNVLCCAGIVASDWPFIRTVRTLSDHNLKVTRHRRPKIENAGITKCDVIATNGIIHEINDVISTTHVRPQYTQFQQAFF